MKPDSTPDDLVELGRVVSAYGVRGWIKVQPHSMQTKALLDVRTWWLKTPLPGGRTGVFSSPKPYAVQASRQHGAAIVAQFSGVDDRDQAQALKGATVWAPRSQFPAPAEEEYYWVDLIGCHFYGEADGQAGFMGRVAEILDNGAHAILVVHRGHLDAQGEFLPLLDDKSRVQEELVPFVEAVVHTVDLAERRLYSHWAL